MQCKKIDLPPMSRTTKRTAAETLAELFRRQSRGQTAEINGANYFYGITALSQEPCPDYRVSMYINDQQDWQDAWQHIGLKPPGKLPYGVHGQMMLYARTGSEISLDRSYRRGDFPDAHWGRLACPVVIHRCHKWRLQADPGGRGGKPPGHRRFVAQFSLGQMVYAGTGERSARRDPAEWR